MKKPAKDAMTATATVSLDTAPAVPAVPISKANEPRRRDEDQGWITRTWDWIDSRQIDKHAVSLGVLYGTVLVTRWAMAYAERFSDKSGVEVAAVIAAIMAPYMALQAATLGFYFKART